jgi:hypothetical protein
VEAGGFGGEAICVGVGSEREGKEEREEHFIGVCSWRQVEPWPRQPGSLTRQRPGNTPATRQHPAAPGSADQLRRCEGRYPAAPGSTRQHPAATWQHPGNPGRQHLAAPLISHKS